MILRQINVDLRFFVIWTAVDPGAVICVINYAEMFEQKGNNCHQALMFTVGTRRLRGEATHSRGDASQATSAKSVKNKPSPCFCINAFSSFRDLFYRFPSVLFPSPGQIFILFFQYKLSGASDQQYEFSSQKREVLRTRTHWLALI